MMGDKDSSSKDLIVSDPEIMSGALVFKGTRVPVQNLFDYLEGDETLEEFLDDFPSVTRDQALSVLELSRQSLFAQVR